MKDTVKVDAVLEKPLKAPKEPSSDWKKKMCTVVDYKPTTGILSFMFDKISCQIQIEKNKKLIAGNKIEIKYQGNASNNYKFKY